MITVSQLTKTYGTQPVLSGIDLVVGAGQKVALVGPNGSGKSTLMKIIAGLDQQDSGTVKIDPNACIGYLPQDFITKKDQTIEEFLREETDISNIEERLKNLEQQFEDASAVEAYGDALEQYQRMRGFTFDVQMRTVLHGLGLGSINPARLLSTLSGGERNKVGLAAILLKGVDLLLLDEPTNNLDLPALIWLEQFLQQSEAAALIISHDRAFLDHVVSRVFEIDITSHAIETYRGGYSDFLVEKTRRIQRETEAYERQQDEIARLENMAREQKEWAQQGGRQEMKDNDKFSRGFFRDRSARLGKNAKTAEKRIGQMEDLERPIQRPPMQIPLEPQANEAKSEIELRDVVAGNGGFHIGPLSLRIPYGRRVAILGANGSGKSTLLRAITGDQKPVSGEVLIGSGLVFGNLMQAHENLPGDEQVLAFLRSRVNPDEWSLTYLYILLDRFQFAAEETRKRISELSPGGRARLLLALFAAQHANVLVLDEPTNHLDLEAVETLEEVLATYAGTVVLVSHDRMFLQNVRVDEAWMLENGALKKLDSVDEFVSRMTAKAKRLLPRL